MRFDRILKPQIEKRFHKNKAIILLGARQVGKTTLLNKILEGKDFIFLDGDDPTIRRILANPNTEELKNVIGKHQYVYIDEAQRIESIGITLKIITDQFKNLQLIVSGSSSFEIQNSINEPLTGRKWEFLLFPISYKEIENTIGYLKTKQQLQTMLRFGMYPDVLNNKGDEPMVLKNLVNSYLYKDVLALAGIRKPEILEKLLLALALQVGNEVSYNELAQLMGIDKNTVSNYISLLEQSFIIFKLPSFSRNLRNEIKTNQKIYFYDNGVRNTIIGNFDPIELRPDKGALWENFIIAERRKKLFYENSFAKTYFWRTTKQQEIDYLEVEKEVVSAYEIKWNPKKNASPSKTFTATYGKKFGIINSENFRDFLV